MIRALFITAALLSLSSAARAQSDVNLDDEARKQMNSLRKLEIATLAIDKFYVDSVDSETLTENAIKGMLDKLDPHSVYSTPKEVKALNEPLVGNFEGIGVQFNIVSDTLLVIQPTAGGPSEKAGVIAGDRIVTVNDTAIAGVKMSKTEIMRRLRGPKGTHVTLGVKRHGIHDILSFNIIRDKIPVNTVSAAYMIQPRTGYIRLESFGQTSHKEMLEAIDSLKRDGMESLIIDLQQNGGGLLKAAVDICQEFLDDGDMIVYTEGRSVPRQDYKCFGKGAMSKGKVIVLVDEFSASASEILSGALQDQDRALVVGRRTYGKGLVQRPIELPDGSMIRLTVAHYYTPSGRCIQKPYKKGEREEYGLDYENRLRRGELTNSDSIHFADSLKYFTLKKHRTVYGGGGIMPDRFVPLDTTMYTSLHRKMAAKGIIINTTLRYVDTKREQLRERYPDFSLFNNEFNVPQALIDTMIAKAAEEKITARDENERRKTAERLTQQTKALIARDLWSMNEYFIIMNKDSDIVKTALELLDTGKE